MIKKMSIIKGEIRNSVGKASNNIRTKSYKKFN